MRSGAVRPIRRGRGRRIGIPYGIESDTCPVRTTQSWLEEVGITKDRSPLGLSARPSAGGPVAGLDVARVIKKLADRAGFDAAKYAGHSLRAGQQRLLPWRAHGSGQSCSRPGTAAWLWCGVTLGRAACSGRIARGSWGCN